MTVKVNPPPQLKMPARFFNDPEIRPYFEKQQTILFQLWNRTGGTTDLIRDLSQVTVINVSGDVTITSDQLGSVVAVDTSAADVNVTLPAISSDDIGKSIIVVILDATNDCYVHQGGSDTILGDTSVLMDDQYLSVHFVAISESDWVAQ